MVMAAEKRDRVKIGVIVGENCLSYLSKDELEQIVSRVYFSDLVREGDVLLQSGTRGPGQGLAFIEEAVVKHGFTRLVLFGYSPSIHGDLIENIGKLTGLSGGAVRGVPIRKHSSSEKRIDAAAGEIIRAVKASREIPSFEIRDFPLRKNVLVIGGGIAGVQAAAALHEYGHPVTLVEKASSLGGDLLSWDAAGGEGVFRGLSGNEGPEGLTVLTKSSLKKLDGRIGDFSALVDTPDGTVSLRCGAVVYTAGTKSVPDVPPNLMPVLSSPATEPIEKIIGRVKDLPYKKRVRNIGLVLDLLTDETKASTEMALTIARAVQNPDRFQAFIFCRDVRVSSLDLEKLYDEVRETGAAIVKYESLRFLPGDDYIDVAVQDAILKEEVVVRCDLLGLSKYGIDVSADEKDLEITGILPDRLGRLQENNVHLLHVDTNRPGIFVAGAVRGTYYIPQIIEEAKTAALSVHTLLERGKMEVELSQAQVDADKCVLCLTCIRSCPYKAMHIDQEKGAAASYPEVCQKCGICAGECPAKAISLPAYSDTLVLGQV